MPKKMLHLGYSAIGPADNYVSGVQITSCSEINFVTKTVVQSSHCYPREYTLFGGFFLIRESLVFFLQNTFKRNLIMWFMNDKFDRDIFKQKVSFHGTINPDWKKLLPLSERLVSLGIMRVKLRAHFKPLNTILLR